MDYADGGDIGARIKEQKGRHFTEEQVLGTFYTQLFITLTSLLSFLIISLDWFTQI